MGEQRLYHARFILEAFGGGATGDRLLFFGINLMHEEEKRPAERFIVEVTDGPEVAEIDIASE